MSNRSQVSRVQGDVEYSSQCGLSRSPPTAHFSALIHRNKDQTRKGKRTEAEGGQEATGDRMKKRVRTACNTSCRDLSEDKRAPGSTRWEQRTRETHTSITETNRLPSALVVEPSLSQLKNKGGDNREQLVTFRKLKSRMLLATKKAKLYTLKQSQKGNQVQKWGRVGSQLRGLARSQLSLE